MKILSWSVNGVTKETFKDLLKIIEDHSPEVILLQATRYYEGGAIPEKPVLMRIDPTIYHNYMEDVATSQVENVGGVCALIDIEMEDNGPATGCYRHSISEPNDLAYNEGRLVASELEHIRVFNYHAPLPINDERSEVRAKYDNKLMSLYPQLSTLDPAKPTLVIGNFSLLTSPRDHHSGEVPEGLSCTDRDALVRYEQFITDNDLVDAFRLMYPEEPGFDYHSSRGRTVGYELGMRLNRVLVPRSFIDNVKRIEIIKAISCSTSLPLLIELKDGGY